MRGAVFFLLTLFGIVIVGCGGSDNPATGNDNDFVSDLDTENPDAVNHDSDIPGLLTDTDSVGDTGNSADDGDSADSGDSGDLGDGALGNFGIFAVFAGEFADFRQNMGQDVPAYQAWAGEHMKILGATWTRHNTGLIWPVIEPVIGGGYDWNAVTHGEDVFAAAAEQGVHYLAVFDEGERGEFDPLDNLDAYADFVRAAVERYDGDGIDDAPGSISIKYWQVGNEIMGWTRTGRTSTDYVTWFSSVARAAKEADPEAKLVLIASTSGHEMAPFHAEVLNGLAAAGVGVDVVDIHHWGGASIKESTMTAVPEYRRTLDSLGMTETEIWSGEHGTYVGRPLETPRTCNPPCAEGLVCTDIGQCAQKCTVDAGCPAVRPSCQIETGLCGRAVQSQVEQARSLIYRYVINRALGVRRIFWNNLVAWRCFAGRCDGYYDRLGLVADGYGPGETAEDVGRPRLAYYSYAMLSARTDETVATMVGREQGLPSSVYVYRYRRNGMTQEGLIAWATSPQDVTLVFSGGEARLTSLITDWAGNPLRGESLAAVEGKITVSLDQDPVWIAESETW